MPMLMPLRHLNTLHVLAFLLAPALAGEAATGLPRFQEHLITKDLKYGYQLVAADLNRDGKKDLIAIDEGATELAWFENPSWTRHVLATNVPRALNVDCYDLDQDGIPEVVLAYRFESRPEQSIGNVALFKAGRNPRGLWTAREIDRVPTAHRVRWIDPEGTGKKVLLLGPMVGIRFPPVEGDSVPIYLYHPESWARETITTEPRGVLHAITPVHWPSNRVGDVSPPQAPSQPFSLNSQPKASTPRQQLLAASYLGLQRYEFTGGKWQSTLISPGHSAPWPKCGSSEVRLAQLGELHFLVTIEPWHGNEVVVYTPDRSNWKRTVIETAMENGHALAAGDLNADGRDEIVAGFRGKGHQLSIYQAADSSGQQWQKTVLDQGGMAGADCVIADFTGDGTPDIVCIGAGTGNIKLYENLGTAQ